MIAATRLRRGSVNSARGAARLVADALVTARTCGAGGPTGAGLVLLRADSAFFSYDTLAAARRRGAFFSVTARRNPAVGAAISSIDDTAGRRSATPTRCSTPTSSARSAVPTLLDRQPGQLLGHAASTSTARPVPAPQA